MPRKKSKKKNKFGLAKTKPTAKGSEVEIVTGLSQLNNNVSSYETVDEIFLESFTKKRADDFNQPDSSASDVQIVSAPIKKRVDLKSRGGVKRHKYGGSKFERKFDTICLDRFFIRKVLKKKKKSRRSKVVYMKADEDDAEIAFKVMEKQFEGITEIETKDQARRSEVVEIEAKDQADSKEISVDNSLEDLKDLDLFPDENYDLELGDLEKLLSVNESQLDQEINLETELETAFDLLEVILPQQLSTLIDQIYIL